MKEPDTQGLKKVYIAFLFADVRGFTNFTIQHGDEAAFHLVQRLHNVVASAVPTYFGRVWKREGDQILVTFPTAFQAVRAAVQVMSDIAEYNKDAEHALKVGLGVDVGEPVSAAGDFIGATVNRTARLTASAKAGQILTSQTAYQLTSNLPDIKYRGLGSRSFQGFRENEEVFEVVWRQESASLASRIVNSMLENAPLPTVGIRPPRIGLTIATLLLVLAGFIKPAEPQRGSLSNQLGALPLSVSQSAKDASLAGQYELIAASLHRYTARIISKKGDETHFGTGIICDRRGLMVTALQVVEGAASVEVALPDGTITRAEVVAGDQDSGLAVLQLPPGSKEIAPLEDSSEVSVGEQVLILGYPTLLLQKIPQITIGSGTIQRIISNKQQPVWQIKAALDPGESGAPVLDRDGRIIGIVVGRGENQDSSDPDVGWAIPSEAITRLLSGL